VLRSFGGCHTYHTPARSEASRWLAHNHINRGWNRRYEEEAMGGNPYRAMGGHDFKRHVPPQLYEEHPEFFPMYTDKRWAKTLQKQGYELGQRVPYRSVGSMGTSFCTSSPEARKYLVEKLVARFRENPKDHSVPLGQDDGNTWCECPRCRGQDRNAVRYRHHAYGEITAMGDRYFDLVTHLTRELRKHLPDRPIQVASMAYSRTLRPPTNTEKLPASVSVTAVIGSYAHLHLPVTSPRNREIVGILEEWGRRTEHLDIWTHEFLKTGSKAPLAGITSLAEWMRFWKRLGVEGHLVQSTKRHELWRCNPWCNYAWARLNWNPEEPADKIIDDFFTGYFREAAEPMKDYYLAIENRVRDQDLSYGLGTLTSDCGDIFTPEFMAEIDQHLRLAEDKAADYRTRRRVAGIREGFSQTARNLKLELPKEQKRASEHE